MDRLTNLLLLGAPLSALAGGLFLIAAAALHLSRVRSIPGVPLMRRMPAVACLLLGTSSFGLGATYLGTTGRTGYDEVYLFWLAVAVVAGVLGMLPRQ